ncbi:hypothetical protein NC652_019112 [Populus alba x Populus x berolinensis]|nr:hypothetical protein NC652_019112 [Populus alba x Populus x berolinensis]
MDEIFCNLFLEDNLGFAVDSVMWALKSQEDIWIKYHSPFSNLFPF